MILHVTSVFNIIKLGYIIDKIEIYFRLLCGNDLKSRNIVYFVIMISNIM